MEDWYNASPDDVRNNGGGGLLTHYYSGSLSSALQTIYPKHDWQPWKFKGSLEMWVNQKPFFDWLGVHSGFNSMDDWYSVSVEDILDNGGRGLLNGYYSGSPFLALSSVYPEHKWRTDMFKPSVKKQSMLET